MNKNTVFLSIFRYYCATPGLSTPTDLCDAGWFCTGAAIEAKPSDSTTGGLCPVGFYCPKGSVDQLPCSPGMYCDSPGLGEPTGNCSAGYYCTLGAATAMPTDNTQGL